MQSDTQVDLSEVTIVLLSHNRKDELERNLPPLAALAANSGCELIVVDNASTDGSTELIAQLLKGRRNVRFIANHTNLGVAGGRNTGWRAATREFILNIDDDLIITEDSIVSMLSVLRGRSYAGIVSPRILGFRTGEAQCDHGSEEREIANFHGACHLVRTSVAVQAGLNDEACSFGGEELDLSIRVRTGGYAVLFTPQTTVLHNNIVKSGPEGKGRRKLWIYNFVRIFYKNFPIMFATILAARYIFSHVISGLCTHGPLFAVNLLTEALRGFRDGRRQHTLVPEQVVRFYRDPDLRPEFGNAPIWRKLANKMRRYA